MEAVVLHRVGFLAYFCPKQGQDVQPLAGPLYPNMGQVTPPPPDEPMLSLQNFELNSHICTQSSQCAHGDMLNFSMGQLTLLETYTILIM